MTRRWNVRAALAALVGLGVAAGLARAQAPAPPPAASPEPWAVIEYGSPPPQTQPTSESGAIGFQKKGPIRDCVHGWMHDHGLGCWSHHNAYTCGSWKSECTFVFGSCKEFFGEPCLAGPPQPPYPPGYGPPPNFGAPPGYGAEARKSGCPSCQ